MSKTFFAEMLTRSEFDRANKRLEISICNASGERQTISISAAVAETLSSILADHFQSHGAFGDLTKIPDHYAVGHGRHEPVVMLRFENEPAYGLTADQALDLGEMLIDEVEAMTKVKYPARQ